MLGYCDRFANGSDERLIKSAHSTCQVDVFSKVKGKFGRILPAQTLSRTKTTSQEVALLQDFRRDGMEHG